MNRFHRSVAFIRVNWGSLLIVGMMVAIAILAGCLVKLEEKQAFQKEATTAEAQQRSSSISSPIGSAYAADPKAEKESSQNEQRSLRPVPRPVLLDTPDRVLSRASLRMATWSIWIGIFIGLIGSLIGVGQLVSAPVARGGRRNCLILQSESRDLGRHIVRLINVGSGSLSLVGIKVLDGAETLISIAGATLAPEECLDVTLVPPHGVPRSSIEVVITGGIDGRGLTGSFEYDPVAGYILRRQLES